MITGIGFRFLHFDCPERTATQKGAYQISVSALRGSVCGLESGDLMNRSYTYLYLPFIYTSRNIYKLTASAGRPSSLPVVARRSIFCLRLSSANYVATQYFRFGEEHSVVELI